MRVRALRSVGLAMNVAVACALLVHPGVAQVKSPAPHPIRATEPSPTRSDAAVVSGAGLILSGMVVYNIGLVLSTKQVTCHDDNGGPEDCSHYDGRPSAILMPAGASLMAAGIAATMWGASDVRAQPGIGAGIALTTIGAAAVVAGPTTLFVGMRAGTAAPVAALGLTVVGTALLITGSAVYLGANRPAGSARSASPTTPEVALSPFGGSVRWRF